MKDPNNKKDATCGKDGNACQACSGTTPTCDQTTVVCAGSIGTGGGGGTGGGTGGGIASACNSTNCAGCCPAGGGACIPYLSQNGTSCGASGAACGACAGGQVCSLSASGCTTSTLPDAGPEAALTGKACAADNDCGAGTAGVNLKCRLNTELGDSGYPGGYCTKLCGSASPTQDECASDATCVSVGARLSEPKAFCVKNCDDPSECRDPGYACYDIGEEWGVCWLDPLPRIEQDGGPVPTTVGAPCMADTDCQAVPSPGVFCIKETETLLDGGPAPTGFTGGYCTRDECDLPERLCAPDDSATCISFNQGEFNQCMKMCSPDGGAGGCRTGYICEGLGLPDGGPSPDGICYPNCNNIQGWCGQGGTCTANGFCQ